MGLDDKPHQGDTIDPVTSDHEYIPTPRSALPFLPSPPEQMSTRAPIMRSVSAATRATTVSCLQPPSYHAELSANEVSLAGGPLAN